MIVIGGFIAVPKDVVKLIFKRLTIFEQAKFALALCDDPGVQKILTGKHYHKLIQHNCVPSILWLVKQGVKLKPAKIRQAYRAVAQYGRVDDLNVLANSRMGKVPNVLCQAVQGGNIETCQWLLRFHKLLCSHRLHLAVLCIVDVTTRWNMIKFLYSQGWRLQPLNLINFACRMKDGAFLKILTAEAETLTFHPYSRGHMIPFSKETVKYVMQREIGLSRNFCREVFRSVLSIHAYDYDLVFRAFMWSNHVRVGRFDTFVANYLHQLRPEDGIEFLTKLWDHGYKFYVYLSRGPFQKLGYPDYILKKIDESNRLYFDNAHL